MKIQINNLEALERLIGGDTDIEMEIRNSVAENFAKKWLSTLARYFIELNLNEAYEKELSTLFKREYNYATSIVEPKMTSEARAISKDYIKNTFKSLIDEKVSEFLNEDKEFLEKTVKDYVGWCVEAQLKKLTKELVEAEAKKQIQEKFK